MTIKATKLWLYNDGEHLGLSQLKSSWKSEGHVKMLKVFSHIKKTDLLNFYVIDIKGYFI